MSAATTPTTGTSAGIFLTPAELVRDLRERKVTVCTGTLRNWRSSAMGGPQFYRIAGRIYYERGDIEDWLAKSRFGDGHQRCPRPKTPTVPGDSTEQEEK